MFIFWARKKSLFLGQLYEPFAMCNSWEMFDAQTYCLIRPYARTTTTATETPQNTWLKEQRESLCTACKCVLHFGTSLCRPRLDGDVN